MLNGDQILSERIKDGRSTAENGHKPFKTNSLMILDFKSQHLVKLGDWQEGSPERKLGRGKETIISKID